MYLRRKRRWAVWPNQWMTSRKLNPAALKISSRKLVEMGRSLQYGVEEAVVGFCRFVWSHGLSAGITETLNALRAVEAVGIAGEVKDRQIVKAALRAVLCSSKAEWDQFEDLFEAFWNSRALQSRSLKEKEEPG